MINGWQAAATAITQAFGLDPPLSRKQVYAWVRRGSINAVGETFPQGPPFHLPAVVDWYAKGVTAPGGARWETPVQRNERLAHPTQLDQLRRRNARIAAGREGVDK